MTQDRTCHIAVIPGDGIGQEVIREGLRVLDFLAEASAHTFSFTYETLPWGCQYYLETGHMMPPDGLQLLENFSALYFGAVGWPGVPNHISLWGLRLAICQGFDQLGLPTEFARILQAIEATTNAGLVTPDLGGSCTTHEVGDAILRFLSVPHRKG